MTKVSILGPNGDVYCKKFMNFNIIAALWKKSWQSDNFMANAKIHDLREFVIFDRP